MRSECASTGNSNWSVQRCCVKALCEISPVDALTYLCLVVTIVDKSVAIHCGRSTMIPPDVVALLLRKTEISPRLSRVLRIEVISDSLVMFMTHWSWLTAE